MTKKQHKRRSTYTAAIFRRQVILFLGLTLGVLAVVAYVAFASTTIAVTPKPQTQTLTVTVTVGPQPADAQAEKRELTGTVLAQPVTATATGAATPTSTTEEPAKATGIVTLINNWTKTQPLQAETRLLSESGVLFRTTSRVDVPAGGTAEATVEADQQGKSGEIGPSRFEIVALWQGLKDKIYGESKAAFTGGTKTIVAVTQDDLIAARKDAVAQFEDNGKAQLATALEQMPEAKGWSVLAVSASAITDKPGAVVGDTATTFPYAVSTTLTAVAGDKAQFDAFVEEKARSQLGAGYRFLGFAQDATYAVKESSLEQKTATIGVRATVSAVVQGTNPMFDAKHLTNRSRADIRSYFSQFPDIASVDVRISPFWALRTPSLPDHVRVKINAAEL